MEMISASIRNGKSTIKKILRIITKYGIAVLFLHVCERNGSQMLIARATDTPTTVHDDT